MKSRTHIKTIILLGITIIFTLGCQLASQAVPSPEPAPVSTSTPAGPPTQVPTETPLPEPDISSAVLTLDDLPSGFEEYNLEEMGMSVDDFSDENFRPEEVFIFINPQDFQMVFGFNFLLTERFDRAAFDLGMSQPELTLPALVNGMGSENIQNEKILEGMEDVGDVQIGMTMIANMEGMPAQVDILMFRRDVVGAMVMSMVLEGQSPNITLHELGRKLDQHIQKSLQAIQ
jgi:hypothetical protein